MQQVLAEDGRGVHFPNIRSDAFAREAPYDALEHPLFFAQYC
jgi:hypothetical protein